MAVWRITGCCFIAIALLTWGAVLTRGGQGEAPAAPAVGLRCDAPAYSFGQAPNYRTVEHRFELTNPLDRPVRITGVQFSCGCTVAEVSPRVIPPGGKAQLTAQVALRDRKGDVHVNIKVATDVPDAPPLALAIEGVALSDIQVSPDSVPFGQVDGAAEVQRAVELIGGREGVAFRVTAVSCESPHFAAELATVTPGREYRVNIRTRPPLPDAGARGVVVVQTDARLYERIEIPVSAAPIGPLVIYPEQFDLVEGEKVGTKYLYLRPGKVERFKVLEITPPDAGVQTRLAPLGKGYRIQITGLAASAELDGKAFIIRTDAQQMPEIRVPIRVTLPTQEIDDQPQPQSQPDDAS